MVLWGLNILTVDGTELAFAEWVESLGVLMHLTLLLEKKIGTVVKSASCQPHFVCYSSSHKSHHVLVNLSLG